MRIARSLLIALFVFAAVFYLLVFYPLRDAHHAPTPPTGLLALTNARVYTSPDAPVLPHASILIRDGRIAAIGDHLEIPPSAQILDCAGATVTAGFWNAHVHFTQPLWETAEWKPRSHLQLRLDTMLSSHGFTTVVDTGSNLLNTIPIRRRIETGEILGPAIYTAGAAQYPPHGIPYYLKGSLPRWLLHFMPQPSSPTEAARDERRNINSGADLLKLFTGSYIARGTVLPVPVENAKAAIAVAHAAHQLVFAHESSLAGATVARDSGVDVLAHAIDTTSGVDDAFLSTLIAHHMAMIPTLKMFRTTVTTNPAYLDPIYAQVGRFHALGGDLLFGTDVGYMADYDTTGEFEALTLSGLTPRDILRMLTIAPATRFGVSADRGTIEIGKMADLVLLTTDPIDGAGNPIAFANVKTTVRNGRIIWRSR